MYNIAGMRRSVPRPRTSKFESSFQEAPPTCFRNQEWGASSQRKSLMERWGVQPSWWLYPPPRTAVGVRAAKRELAGAPPREAAEAHSAGHGSILREPSHMASPAMDILRPSARRTSWPP